MLVLGFRCLGGSPVSCVPWTLVTEFAQFMMHQAQRGVAGRYLGHVSSDSGVVVEVFFDILVTVGEAAVQAAGQSIYDSASEIHGY